MSKPVFYTSAMAGFPAGNTRVAGGLIAVLDACLVNGANLTTTTGVTQTGGTVTASFAGNHNFSVGDSVLVEGATPSAYNGRVTVTAKTSNSISWAIDSGTTSPATGTITVKHPGAGWTKSWADTNMAAYRSSTSDNGVGAYMQIENNNPYNDSHVSFRWRVCEGHTGLNTAARLATDLRQFWQPYDHSFWWVVADDRTAYIHWSGPSDAHGSAHFVMGEVSRLVTTDTYAWVFPGYATTGIGQPPSNGLAWSVRSEHINQPLQVLRTWAGLAAVAPASVTLMGAPYQGGAEFYLWDQQRSGSAPNPITGAVELVPVRLIERVTPTLSPGGSLIRGNIRGVYHLTGKLTPLLFESTTRTKVLSDVEIGGVPRRILVTRIGSNAEAQLAFDLTGPWG